MDIARTLDALDGPQAKALLAHFLTAYCTPAFGTLPKREVDLLVYGMLQDCGALGAAPSLYDLMTDLRISRTRARALLFDLQIRQAESHARLQEQVKTVMLNDSYFRDHNWFVLEVENPLVQAHLREICRRAHVVTDASFSASIVRLPVSGLAHVLAAMLSEDQQDAVKRGLYRTGKLQDKSLPGILRSALGDLARKFVGKAAGELTDGAVGVIGDFLQPLFDGDEEAVVDLWSQIYPA